MQFRNDRSLPLFIVMCLLTTVLVVVPVTTYALPVVKSAASTVGNPWWMFWLEDDEIVAQSFGHASHLRLWGPDHYIHAHSGDGYAYARVANISDSDSDSFSWIISSTNSPSHPGAMLRMDISAGRRGHESDSAFTYCWVRSGGSTTHSSDSN